MSARLHTTTLLVVLSVLVICVGCDRARDDRPDAEDVAAAFAEAMSAQDYSRAASLTDAPTTAANDLTFMAGQLQAPSSTYVLSAVSSSVAEGTAEYDVSLDVLGTRLDYRVTAALVTDAQNAWKVDWSPSVIHPELTSDTHLEIETSAGPSPVVLDRNGQPLLSEQYVTVVRIDPAAVSDPAGVASTLAGVLGPVVPGLTAQSITDQLAAATEPYTLVALRPEAAASITLPELAGVSHNEQSRLLTAAPSLHSPALSGLKDAWQAAATKSAGWSLQLQDAGNEQVETLIEVPGTASHVLATTFDATVHAAAQQAVDEVTAPEQQAVIVAIQPSTGGIISVAQNAAADAEGPVALTGLYPPGSTFKVISTAAVLAAGAAQPDTVLPCPGKATIKGRTIPNDEQFDLGSIPLHTAFAHSCNTTIAGLTATLPADALRQQALQFGLGVDYLAEGLTTITGTVPAADSDAQLVEDSIGQGKVVASPFAMALAAATVVRGSTPPPVILTGTSTTADQQPPAPAPATLEALRTMMSETVSSGTAQALADIDGVAGKTGTAQYGDGTHSHGWFIGYYKDLAFAVLVTGADSSKPAVSVAGDFLREADEWIPQ